MKLKLFNSRGKLSPSLYFGKIMWRCRDGWPNYEKSYTISYGAYKHMNWEKVYPIPSLYILRWRRGILSSIDDLGTTTHSLSIGIEWWNFQCMIMFLRARHAKTTEEINKGLAAKGLDLVL